MKRYAIYLSKNGRNTGSTICFWLTTFDNRDDWQKGIRSLMHSIAFDNNQGVKAEYKMKDEEHQAILHIGE